MVVDAGRLPVETLARAAAEIGAATDLRGALAPLARAAAEACGADLAVVRVLDGAGDLAARAVAPQSSSLGAEVAGTRVACDVLAAGTVSEPLQRAAARVHAAGTIALVARGAGDRVLGSLELIRVSEPFDDGELALAELATSQLALAIRMFGPETRSDLAGRGGTWLELAGDALAAGGDTGRIAQQTVRAAVEATGAQGGTLWRTGTPGQVELLASSGAESGLEAAAGLVREFLGTWRPVAIEEHPDLPGDATRAATVSLGQPAFGVLQLYFLEETMPPDHELPALAAFATRAAHALRAGEQASQVEEELGRTRALLEVVGEAIARLSLAHTLETAVERISELLGVERVGVYLREDGQLFAAAGRGLSAGHEEVAARLLEVALGPLRARAAVYADVADDEPALAGPRAALAAAGQRSVLAVPLHVRDDSIGLLVAYPGARTLGESDISLLTSLAAQLAVAVQNARLHERSKELGEALGEVLATERQTLAAGERPLRDLPLVRAEPVARHDARRRDGDDRDGARRRRRGDPRSRRAWRPVHAACRARRRHTACRSGAHDPRAAAAASVALPGAVAARRRVGDASRRRACAPDTVPREGVDGGAAPDHGRRRVARRADDPLARPGRADRRGHARDRADDRAAGRTRDRQRTALPAAEAVRRDDAAVAAPSERPDVPGLEVGTVYESAAQVDVGGDVFDFMELPDGRLAVVLGDVTGHGIDATADMAMAKFVFRSLAREHPEPSDFLAHANDVVVGEIAVGKFITMAYLLIDPRGTVDCASAGHPEPRLVLPDGRVESLRCGGLALGIDAPQTYDPVRAELPPGSAVVLYTDGVIEARRGADLFGSERLDALLAERAGRPAQEIADAVVGACRAYAGGNLGDDCAIVVIKKT